jgi:hypothetical protein
MKRRCLFPVTVCYLFWACLSFAGTKTYTVEGEITFNGTGNIFVSLVTEELFGKKYEGSEKKSLSLRKTNPGAEGSGSLSTALIRVFTASAAIRTKTKTESSTAGSSDRRSRGVCPSGMTDRPAGPRSKTSRLR